MKPNLYFNSLPDPATDISSGKQNVLRAAISLQRLQEDIGSYYIDSKIELEDYVIAKENDRDVFFRELFYLEKGHNTEDITKLNYILAKFNKCEKINIEETECNYRLEELNISSPILEKAFKDDAMVFSFASESYWEEDFLSFENQNERLPNIWGQEDLSSLKEWIEEFNRRKSSFSERLEREFNAVICCDIPSNLGREGKIKILNALTTAKAINHKPGQAEILQVWQGSRTDYGSLLELRPQGIRVFYIYYDGKIAIGNFYFKGSGNDMHLERKAAKKAIKRINAHIKEKENG